MFSVFSQTASASHPKACDLKQRFRCCSSDGRFHSRLVDNVSNDASLSTSSWRLSSTALRPKNVGVKGVQSLMIHCIGYRTGCSTWRCSKERAKKALPSTVPGPDDPNLKQSELLKLGEWDVSSTLLACLSVVKGRKKRCNKKTRAT